MKVKRWFKKHGRLVVFGLSVLCIISNVWGLTSGEGKVAFHVFAIALMTLFILTFSGAISKFFEWWEKD